MGVHRERRALCGSAGPEPLVVREIAELQLAVREESGKSVRASAAASARAASAVAWPPEPGSREADAAQRESERRAHYEKELEYRGKFLADHAQEPVDKRWSQKESEQIRGELPTTSLGEKGQLKNVDCRSKTCTATVSYPTPGDGLTLFQQAATKLSVEGCNGFSIIPTPPSSDGPYDLTIMYTCR